MKDYRSNWMVPAQPLGPALRKAEPKHLGHFERAVSYIRRVRDFETNGMLYDSFAEDMHGPRFGPPAQESKPQEQAVAQAPVPTFRVGDRVRVCGHIGTIVRFQRGPLVKFDSKSHGFGTVGDNCAPFLDCSILELIPTEPAVKADEQGWKKEPPTEPGWYVIGSTGTKYLDKQMRARW